MGNVWRSARLTLETIKWEHSIFALPFALTGAVLAAGGWPRLPVLGWIVVCMVSARSAAMAFNRLVDARLDAANPRTAMRALPAGKLSAGFVAGFVVVSSAVFVLGAAMLNRLTLELAGRRWRCCWRIAMMKRVTRWSHAGTGAGAGDCAVGGVDCGARLTGCTYRGAERGGAAMGWRLRRAVRVPGL
jgi:4-hydroxybenzoate polyprenyltransferase